MDGSHVYKGTWALGGFQSYYYPNLSKGADHIGGQLHGDKECPFSGITKSGRLWRKVLESKHGFSMWFYGDMMLSWKMGTVPHADEWGGGGGELVMLPEIERNVGSELPLTLFEVTNPGLGAVKTGKFWQQILHPGIRDWVLKTFNWTHLSSVMQIWTLKKNFFSTCDIVSKCALYKFLW